MAYQRRTRGVMLIAFLSMAGLYLPASVAIADTSPPVIIHSVAPSAAEGSDNTSLSATVSDASDIKAVLLYFRVAKSQDFGTPREMRESADGSSYSYTFKPTELVQPGLEYYITAEDVAGNVQSRGFAFDPLTLNVERAIIVNAQAGEAVSSEKKINKIWYVVGGVLAAGLIASQLDEEETVINSTYTFVAR